VAKVHSNPKESGARQVAAPRQPHTPKYMSFVDAVMSSTSKKPVPLSTAAALRKMHAGLAHALGVERLVELEERKADDLREHGSV
jgi:hypothetical protein